MRLRLTIDAPTLRALGELVNRSVTVPIALGSHQRGNLLEFFVSHAMPERSGLAAGATFARHDFAPPRTIARTAQVVLQLAPSASGVRLHGWAGWFDQWRPFDELRIPGAGPSLGLTLPLPACWNDDLEATLSQGARALARRCEPFAAALVGCSRLGSQLASGLAETGVNKLALIDDDRVEEHQLDAMDVTGPTELGERKAEAVARWLEARPESRSSGALQATPFATALEEPEALRSALDAELIVTAPDRGEPRLVASLAAATHRRVLLDVGTGVFELPGGGWLAGADIRLVVPGNGCLLCVGGLDLERRRQIDFRRERAGSLGSLNAMATALALRCIEQLRRGELRRSSWLRLTLDRDGTPHIEEPRFELRRECPICSRGGAGDEAWGALDAVGQARHE